MLIASGWSATLTKKSIDPVVSSQCLIYRADENDLTLKLKVIKKKSPWKPIPRTAHETESTKNVTSECVTTIEQVVLNF